MPEFEKNPVSSIKVGVYLDENGYILAEGDPAAIQKNVTFHGFASSMTATEAINNSEGSALHNGISGLMWLFSGYDEGNFNENFIRTVTEELNND